ncbi:MAG: SAM-dependent DNA methyltransferase [Caldilineales bacterium]|nr:SAM-dependent DNA methyltransferase [Caldilineales bacterium]
MPVQPSFYLPPSSAEHLTIGELEQWLWDAACEIRGATDAPKFKDFILPLVFYKRLSDVFDDEFAGLVGQYGGEEVARAVLAADHEDALTTGRKPIVRFYIDEAYRWDRIRHHPADGKLGEFVTDAMRAAARHNPDLEGVVNVKDFNERQAGQRILDDDRLASLVEVLSRHRLGLHNAEPDILGRAYEYLLRKFAEGQGQSAGEFYTPKEVGWLMARLLDPQPYSTAYDPTVGSAGLLIKLRLHYNQRHTDKLSAAPHLYGQELNPTTFAMARMNLFLHDFTQSTIAIGDTLRRPAFSAEGAGLQKFDRVIANPMWNQKNYRAGFYENDKWERFGDGAPPTSSADWGWVQHMAASLKADGRAAIVLDTGAVSRGSGSRSSNKEKAVRQAFVERDWIEGVVLLPDNLFYNTSAPGIILLLNKAKPADRQGQILLVNASNYFTKEKPKNQLTDEGIEAVVEVYRQWQSRDKLSRVITLTQAQEADYNLSPSLFVDVNDRVKHRAIQTILSELAEAKRERNDADVQLGKILQSLNLGR